MDDFENYSVANKLTSVLHMKTYFGNIRREDCMQQIYI